MKMNEGENITFSKPFDQKSMDPNYTSHENTWLTLLPVMEEEPLVTKQVKVMVGH